MAQVESNPGDIKDKQAFNAEVKLWYGQTLNMINANVRSLGMEGKTELLKTVKSPKARFNLLARIRIEGIMNKDLDFIPLIGRQEAIITEFLKIVGLRFDFPKHGIWLQKGSGPGSRKRKNWLNRIMNKQVPLLADIQQKYGADQAVKATKLNIK